MSILAVCLDCGDTIVDEGTEVKDADDVVLRAELIPGAAQMVGDLKAAGYPLALVADGPVGTLQNVLTHYGLFDLFDVYAISGAVGVSKPDARMFHHALEQLEIDPAQYGQTVMVGNNLERDIAGANALGMISVWIDWAPRRAKIPATELEKPDYTIKRPDQLLALLNEINGALTP